jgi:hypothetical protein
VDSRSGQVSDHGRLFSVSDNRQKLDRPFRSADAIGVTMTRHQLASSAWRRVFRGVRVWHEAPVDRMLLIRATALTLPAGGVIGGRSAASVHGVDVALASDEVSVVLSRETHMAPRAGIRIRRAALPPQDVTEVDGIPVTTRLRTAFDLARLEPLVEAVCCLDAFLHAGLPATDLAAYTGSHPGWRGVRRAAAALRYADGAAESPMESRLRMLLVLAGLPRPIVNEPLYDPAGYFLARPDLRIDSVLIEFDGRIHRNGEVFVNDLRRQNSLLSAGYTLLRYSAADVYHRPEAIVLEVRATLLRTRRS